MNHSFNIEVACKLNISKAILLENFYFWIKHNKANNTNFHDGEYWTYNSTRAFSELFPYMSESCIKKNLLQLINDGYLIEGNYNKLGMDRTKWYTFTKKTKEIYNLDDLSEVEKVEKTQKSDSTESDRRNNKVSVTDNSIAKLDNFFNSVWQELPSKMKKGKSAVKKTQKIKLMKVGYEKLNQCLKLYLLEVKNENKFMLNGSTWFNGRYEDYIEQVQKQRVVKKEVEIEKTDKEKFIENYFETHKTGNETQDQRHELKLEAEGEYYDLNRFEWLLKNPDKIKNISGYCDERQINKFFEKYPEMKK